MRLRGHVDAVIFDLDDTLVDHRGAADRGLVAWLSGMGLAEDPSSLAEHTERWIALEARHYERSQRGEITHAEQRRIRIRSFLPGWDLADDDLADDTFAGYLACYQAAWRAFDDAATAIAAARAAGLRVGVLTNGERDLQEAKLRRTGLGGLALPVFASSHLPAAKPDPRSYRAACADLGVPPERTLMIGDSLINDVRGAQRAGLSALLLDRHDRYRAERHPGPDVRVIRALHEVEWSRFVDSEPERAGRGRLSASGQGP